MITKRPKTMEITKSYVFGCLILVSFNHEVTCGRVEMRTTSTVEGNGFSMIDFVSSHGYPIERHENIETKDGYLLDMFRIPYGKPKVDFSRGAKPVAFLMHGLLCSAENWIITGPERGLAFLLADRGYDVWMGNARGTIHSRKHVRLTTKSKEFWQFSWHEIGIYDLPAKISYIIKHTRQTELVYVGHSQGTTAFFVMASENITYNMNIKLMVALAPVAYMAHMSHPVMRTYKLFTGKSNILEGVNGSAEFVPGHELLNLAGQTFCQQRILLQELCANIIFLLAGYDSDQLDRFLVPIIAQTTPAGASLKQMYHYAQEVNSGKFRQYDYGASKNFINYGSRVPPEYDLSSITAPVALFYSNNDWFVAKQDVERLAEELPNVVHKYLVPYESFNHLDFLFAKDVVDLVYTEVFRIMERFA